MRVFSIRIGEERREWKAVRDGSISIHVLVMRALFKLGFRCEITEIANVLGISVSETFSILWSAPDMYECRSTSVSGDCKYHNIGLKCAYHKAVADTAYMPIEEAQRRIIGSAIEKELKANA